MRLSFVLAWIGLTVGAVLALVVPDWHLPVAGRQLGWRASSMVQFEPTSNPFGATQRPPPATPAEPPDTRPATTAFRNVQVLTDTDAASFMRLQHAITEWVAPAQGCAFCHTGTDYASDAKPAKQAARDMLRMVRHVNADWTQHVGQTGVTCFTCHRGQPVPAQIWLPTAPKPDMPNIARSEPWNENASTVRQFFPDAGWAEWYVQDTPGNAQSRTVLPTGQVAAQVVFKRLYEMMMQFSDGIGVNCGYCHNSRAFADWGESTPMRWIGYYGIELTRDLNRNFLLPLAASMPQTREVLGQAREPIIPTRETGLQNGSGLVVCATCHMGRPKPLDGADMLRDFPALRGKPADHP